MLLDDLNPAQKNAVTHAGAPLVVFAGAGSGKTRVITRRIAYAVQTGRRTPSQIVALTFTNKAAREMVARVDELLGGRAYGLTAGTFHSTCSRWLRSVGPRFGLRANFVIYDTDDQKALIRRVLQDLNLSSSDITPKSIATRIDQAKNQGLGPDKVETEQFTFLGSKFRDIYARYEERLGQANALDFGDLILKMTEMLETHEAAREEFRARYQMVLVDEYQDTNRSQYRLLKALVPQNTTDLCVVGDDDQSIYRFRGAELGNILDFSRHFHNTTTIKLEENYRSTQAILDVSNAVIQNNKRREPKALHAARPGGQKPQLTVHDGPMEEAAWLIQNVRAAANSGVKYSEMAVLFRQNALSRIYEEALQRARIPFVLVGGQRFYERAEVKDALAYVRLLVHQESDIDLLRIINTPARGIGDKTVERLSNAARESGISLSSLVSSPQSVLERTALGGAALERVAAFGVLMRQWSEALPTTPPTAFVERLLKDSGLEALYTEDKSVEAESRWKNLQELVSAVAEWSVMRPQGTLSEFLEDLALLSEQDRTETSDRVTLMTIHAAKGLEYHTVMITGLEDGVFPIVREDTNEADFEEERRLFYVAVTRAKDELLLSACRSRLLYGRTQVMEPSRFLFEVPRTLIEMRIGGVDRGYGNVSAGRNAAEPASGPRRGDRVRHNLFGDGEVTEVAREDGKVKLMVRFASVGMKKIAAQYVEALR